MSWIGTRKDRKKPRTLRPVPLPALHPATRPVCLIASRPAILPAPRIVLRPAPRPSASRSNRRVTPPRGIAVRLRAVAIRLPAAAARALDANNSSLSTDHRHPVVVFFAQERRYFRPFRNPQMHDGPANPAAPFPPRHIKGTLFAQGAFNSIARTGAYASNGFAGPSAQFLRNSA